MRRQAFTDLKDWLFAKNRKPLVLRGARQVGKSTLVRLFCQTQKVDLIEINLEKTTLKSLKQSTDIKTLLQEIEYVTGKSWHKKSLIFFDEIQRQPELFQALRYIYEEHPEIPVIAAGSLLDFLLEAPDFDVPVGRIQYYHLGPMNFTEFLWAVNKPRLVELISTGKKIPEYAVADLIKQLKIYYWVGGMPEAVKLYSETNDLPEVRKVHLSLLQTYRDDFNKYSQRKKLAAIDRVFDRTPFFVGNKTRYSEIVPDIDARLTKECLLLLRRARLVHFCYHTSANGLPLRAQKNEKIFKLYFLDVGLLNAVQGLHFSDLDTEHITQGVMAEQFVAQHLAYRGGGYEEPELFYWLRDQSSQKAEVDFVISRGSKIIPIEVKSGEVGHLKSLQLFAREKKSKLAIRLDLSSVRPHEQKLVGSHLESNQAVILRNLFLPQVVSIFS